MVEHSSDFTNGGLILSSRAWWPQSRRVLKSV
jgi:hypothetical protein